MCGGTAEGERGAVSQFGLSPRVRGNRGVSVRTLDSVISIPACAGEPAEAVPSASAPTVYPRVCGGTRQHTLSKSIQHGLSPRVRGNRRRRIVGILQYRSIPACAGEPAIYALTGDNVEVYPRVCGGTGARAMATSVATGLSPRVRGNR